MPQNLLVTGSRGGNSPHVTSAQAANYNAGIVGDGQYVMSGLTATMKSPNICHIDPGVASMNGRDVEVPAGGVDVAVDNGTQAQQRHDLVCLRYTAASEGSPEAVELVCIKGTPAASNAQDPAYNDGSVLDGDSPVDMPLYRVSLNGVSVSEPVKLYDNVPSIESLRDSVSQSPHVSIGKSGGSNNLGIIVCHPEPPEWALDRNPDCFLYSLAENDNEGLSKIFYLTLWSFDAPSQAQIRLWRKDTDTWAPNQGAYAYWCAIWNR